MHFQVPRAKLAGYLLDPKHPAGGGKARIFAGLGFPPRSWRRPSWAMPGKRRR
ncbi:MULTISPECIES: DUF6883 domain-containing protein [Thermus]|uniref:DUF6883 domain-containing protein n=1 Tax=Thermus TaxID=270 RepID=UPI000A47E572